MDENLKTELVEQIDRLKKKNLKESHVDTFYEGVAFGERLAASMILSLFSIFNMPMSKNLRKQALQEKHTQMKYLSGVTKENIKKTFEKIK